MPILRHIANLWTLMEHPSAVAEWTLQQKLAAIQEAGFDGVCWAANAELQQGASEHGLIFIGGIASADPEALTGLLEIEKRFGAHHVNVQLGTDDMLTPKALAMTLEIMSEGRRLGLQPAIESHRGTCTETPEKLYALADAYADLTGELLPISWDFSHFAVVKHLLPTDFVELLLLRPDLIQRAQQFHLRPFNGHHAQIPITNGRGEITREVREWMPFAEALLRCWLSGNPEANREIFVCPELGPLEGGYALSTFPSSWDDAKVLRLESDRLWTSLTS